MEEINQAKQLIAQAKNIYIVPNSSEPESIACALALFYTLKESNKNVNLIQEDLPENLKFLMPSTDFITYPKNFVVSIPNKIADISQIYYEKNDDSLKIHLTVSRGNIKKENISFYFSEPKPDLMITLGIKSLKAELQNGLNSFGFLLDSAVLNIDSASPNSAQGSQTNEKFGRINLIGQGALAEILFELAKADGGNPIKKEAADCLLAALIIFTDNFKGDKVTAGIFETAAALLKRGAEPKKVTDGIYKKN